MSFFNDKSNRVERKYIGSSFIGHGDAETCLKSLIDVLGNLDYVNNLIQMDMDGLNVNWNLFDMMKQDRLEKNPKAPVSIKVRTRFMWVTCCAWSVWYRRVSN